MAEKYPVKVLLVLSIAILVVTVSGVWWLADGSEQRSSAIGGTDIAPNNTVPSSPPFLLEGQIHYQFDPSQVGDSSFENVMLCVYGPKEREISSENLGTFDGAAETVDISIRTETMPKYIIIHHPRFYTIDGFQHETMVFSNFSNRFRDEPMSSLPIEYNQLDKGSCRLPTS